MATRGKPRAIAKDPERAKLEELQSLIVNPDDVGEPLANPEFPERKLLHKGALDRILPTGVVEDGVVILLSDLLIYCLEDAHGLLTVDGVIEITEGASVKAANQLAATDDLCVLNVLSSEGYGYTFVAEDANEQKFWFDLISLAIDPDYVAQIEDDDQHGDVDPADDRDEQQSEYSSRPASRQSIRTYEQDLTVASQYSGDEALADHPDDTVDSRESSRPQSRNSFRNGRTTPDVSTLKLADNANASSQSSSRASISGYKSPDSFLSQRSVSTLHPQDTANEDALMGQVASLPNLLQIQQIAEALGKRTVEQRLLMMSNPEGCVMIKFNVSNGNPVARKVRLSSDRESIEWCKADGFIESWGSRLWIKDIAALRFAPSLDTKVYKHGSVADYLIFACVLLQGSIMYKKAPRRYQIKAENAKIGIADVPIERNAVMEVPALVFAARRGIDVLDWYLGLQHLIQLKGMSDTDVSSEEIILRVASEDPSAIIHQRQSQVYLKSKILEQMRENRKKEIIVERYEAKLKEEHEMLEYELQRANETRQRNQVQRNRTPASGRGGGQTSSSRRTSANRRSALDDDAPAPSRSQAPAASSRLRRPQESGDEYDANQPVRRAAHASAGRRAAAIDDEEEEVGEEYVRRSVGKEAPRSRGRAARDEVEEDDEEVEMAPVSRRGNRGADVGQRGGNIASSSAAPVSRRAQA